MGAFRVRISLRLTFLLMALASILLATWQLHEKSRRLRLEGQKALAQTERDVLLIGIRRNPLLYQLEEDRYSSPHDPYIDLKRHDDCELLNAIG
jgi:hypothetical protein